MFTNINCKQMRKKNHYVEFQYSIEKKNQKDVYI
jgi:hypothetical protein